MKHQSYFFKLLRKPWRLLNLFRYVNPFTTIFWNFKLLPFEQARKIPLYIGYNVDFMHVKRNAIILKTKEIKRGMIEIGILRFPIFPAKGVHTLIRIEEDSKILFGGSIRIAPGCSLVSSYGGHIELGDDVFINMYSLIYCNENIKIGNHVAVGWKSQIYDSNIHIMIDTTNGIMTNPHKLVVISDNVWLANNVTIAPCSQIPSFCIVASHSLVNKNFMSVDGIGHIIKGLPGQIKNVGKVRIFNEKIEYVVKQKFKNTSTVDAINIDSMDLSPYPFDANNNILYKYR